MRFVSHIRWPAAPALLIAIGAIASSRVVAAPPPPRPVVIAELFTSEGCSSCPPADAVLGRLASGELTDVADVVALGEHVDYWDRLGWRDPFSAAVFTARQSEYVTRVFRTDNIYTPQLVVDGKYECVGSDRGAVRRAVASAALGPKASVTVSVERQGPTRLRAYVRVEVPATLTLKGPADVMVAVTEDRLVSRVQRGENGGRTLAHQAVVRWLTPAGALAAADRSSTVIADIPIAPGWHPANLRVVGFVQERESRRIVGAAATSGGHPGDSR